MTRDERSRVFAQYIREARDAVVPLGGPAWSPYRIPAPSFVVVPADRRARLPQVLPPDALPIYD